jgi:hypothetical protein
MALDLKAQEAEEIFVMRTIMICSSPSIISFPLSRGPGFDLSSVLLGFVVNEVALGHGFV